MAGRSFSSREGQREKKMMRLRGGIRSTKRVVESFDFLCRRAGISPGDPTPAVSSPWSDQGWTESYSVNVKGSATMPVLTTTVEVFCLRMGRRFKVGGTAIRAERYQYWKYDSDAPLASRNLVACKHCSDTHQLLSAWQAASFGFLGDPVANGSQWTRKSLRFGRKMNRHIFDRKRFPPVETESETEAA
jgi:hypothetical protein